MGDFQSYLSPCLTGKVAEKKDTTVSFQSYLSPCLTPPSGQLSHPTRDLSILPQSVFNIAGEKRAGRGNKYCFQSYLSPCLTRSLQRSRGERLRLSILPQSVFNISMNGFNTKISSLFQSYLSPCLTLLLAVPSSPRTSFQSYLSPCLTRRLRRGQFRQYELSILPQSVFNQ